MRLVDFHMHIYESRAQGQSQKDSYEILEYGSLAGVRFSERAGDLQEALASLADAGFDRAVIANLFYTAPGDPGIIERGPGSLDGSSVSHDAASARDRLIAYNHWACELSRRHDRLIPFVALDPAIMSAAQMSAHLIEMVSKFGARGVKLHPTAQRFAADDERMLPALSVCAELEIPVLIHSGSSMINTYSEPRTIGRLMEKVPDLRPVVAHLGGGAWRQTRDLAQSHSNIYFDCAEIIAWTGAPGAPTRRELAELIRDVGPDRVLLGSDFPWYDLDQTVEQVLALPILSTEEKEGILGLNASRLLKLPDTKT